MKRSPYFPPPEFHPRGTAVLPPAVLLPSPASARAARSRAGQRRRWQGRVTAVVATPPMLGLGGVTDEAGVAVWDCLWLHYTKHLHALGLVEGDMLTFVARVDRLLDGSYTINRPLEAERIEA